MSMNPFIANGLPKRPGYVPDQGMAPAIGMPPVKNPGYVPDQGMAPPLPIKRPGFVDDSGMAPPVMQPRMGHPFGANPQPYNPATATPNMQQLYAQLLQMRQAR